MKNNLKRKNDILIKNQSQFNKDMNIVNNKSNKVSFSDNIKDVFKNEIINKKINNNPETFELLIKDEIEKSRISHQKIEKLKNINLYENYISDLYNWNTLFKYYIPVNRYISPKNTLKNNDDKSEIKEKADIIYPINNKEKETSNIKTRNKNNIYNYHSKTKNNNNIDYTKGINVICKLSISDIQNYYEQITKKRKKIPQLGPKIKLKNKNLGKEIKIQRLLSFNKEIKLNSLLSNEVENKNFKNEDLIIAAKRKNADILIKSIHDNLKDKKINFNTMNSFDNFENNKKNRKWYMNRNKKRKKGLILSYYNENNPYIKIFNKAMDNICQDKEEDEVIKPTLKRNFFSSFDLNFNNFSFSDINNLNNENEKNIESSERYKTHRSENKRQQIQINNNNYFKNHETTKNSNYSSTKLREEINSNKRSIAILHRPMSSSNLKSQVHKKFGFIKINLNANEENLPNELKTINYMQSFPKKSSSKILNNIYDKINRMIKTRAKKKSQLKLKKNKNKNKNSIKITSNINNKNYEYSEEDMKNNKTIFKNCYDLKKQFKNNINNKILSEHTNNIKYDFFEDDYKYENLKNKVKIFDSKSILKNMKTQDYENPFIINKNINNYYSCSNNYIVNNKRKNKNKYLSDYNSSSSLNEILSDILYEDKFSQDIYS